VHRSGILHKGPDPPRFVCVCGGGGSTLEVSLATELPKTAEGPFHTHNLIHCIVILAKVNVEIRKVDSSLNYLSKFLSVIPFVTFYITQEWRKLHK
jgi:hypothetical protein